jgi:hypothetical protein
MVALRHVYAAMNEEQRRKYNDDLFVYGVSHIMVTLKERRVVSVDVLDAKTTVVPGDRMAALQKACKGGSIHDDNPSCNYVDGEVYFQVIMNVDVYKAMVKHDQ